MAGSTSSLPTPTRSERATIGDGPGGCCMTGSPATSTRSRPCQPSATSASPAGTSAHASGSSAATGPNSHARALPHPAGRADGSDRLRDLRRVLDPPVRRLGVDEHRPAIEARDRDVDAGVAQDVELARLGREAVRADQRPHAQPEPGQRQRRVRDAAAEPPAARIVVDEVSRRGPDHDDLRHVPHLSSAGPDQGPTYTCVTRGRRAPNGRGRERALRSVHDRGFPSCTSTSCTKATTTRSPTCSSPARTRWRPRSSSRSSSRSAVGSRTPTRRETLIEAIAEELERDYDFVAVTDDRLTAAINVSKDEEENFLADLEAPETEPDYVSILADLEAGESRLN